MPAFRFLHTSDLHLGRQFASIPQPPDGTLRGRLAEARHGAIARLALAAADHGAAHIVLAGDTFDTTTPSPGIVRQALAAMGADSRVHWWLLPGNHDNLAEAEPLWDGIGRDAPLNVHVLRDARPVSLADDVALLPCPVAWRFTAGDPSAALTGQTTPEGQMRLGLAHGGVVDFGGGSDAIPPDRDRSAGLDYLGLGDWHGRLAIGPRVHYSGTPEQDRFRHDRPGVCLAVTLPGPGALPSVVEVATGQFTWTQAPLALLPGQDGAAALRALLPPDRRRDHLLRIAATGRASLPELADLRAAADHVGAEFGLLDLVTDDVQPHFEAADLDGIDQAGALRVAAEALMAQASDADRDRADRNVAGDALARLYAYMRQDDAA